MTTAELSKYIYLENSQIKNREKAERSIFELHPQLYTISSDGIFDGSLHCSSLCIGTCCDVMSRISTIFSKNVGKI
jgi:hypothetical protein